VADSREENLSETECEGALNYSPVWKQIETSAKLLERRVSVMV
jgi:hypothetical protein